MARSDIIFDIRPQWTTLIKPLPISCTNPRFPPRLRVSSERTRITDHRGGTEKGHVVLVQKVESPPSHTRRLPKRVDIYPDHFHETPNPPDSLLSGTHLGPNTPHEGLTPNVQRGRVNTVPRTQWDRTDRKYFIDNLFSNLPPYL